MNRSEAEHRLLSLEELVGAFGPGVVLWRGCLFDDRQRPYMAPTEFPPSAHGNKRIAHALVDFGSHLYEPTIDARRRKRGDKAPVGVVVMLPEEPPPNWTHLISDGPFHSGKAIRAHYDGTQLDAASYIDFRRRAMEKWLETSRRSLEERIAGARSVPVDGLRPDARRIVTAFDSVSNRFRVEPFDPKQPEAGPVLLKWDAAYAKG